MNANDPVRELAALIARAKPGWSTEEILSAFRDPRVVDQPFWTVLSACGRCYGDAATQGPRRLAERGPWWGSDATGVTPTPERFTRAPKPPVSVDAPARAREALSVALEALRERRQQENNNTNQEAA